jgi:DNA polymerase elongation subunit (family B)
MRHDLNTVERYENRVLTMYMATHPNADPSKVEALIHQLTNDRLRDIPCELHNNITHETIQTSVLETFHWAQQRDPIIVGNGTFFMQHDELLAPTVKMLEKLKANRKKKKNEMYQYKPGTIEYTNAKVGQMSIKVIMNADYGGSGTPLSPFYSCYIPPATTGTAKNITTSLICCLELFSENKDQWAKLNNINELYDMMFSVLEDMTERDLIQDVYTVDEVCKWLISRTNNVKPNDIVVLRAYLCTLSSDELTKLMLAFHPRLVLKKYLSQNVASVMEYLKANQIDVNYLSNNDLSDEEVKKRVAQEIAKYGFGIKTPPEITDDIKYITKVILDNCVYPFVPNDAEVRACNMQRLMVCVTDTDSLMVHFASFIDEFQAWTGNHKSSCLVASALGFRIVVEGVIPKMVSNIAMFYNIKDPYYQKKFVFKNEFTFLAMCLIAKKMYASSMFVQEGNPREPHEIAVSGLSFKKRDAAEFLEPIMLRLYDQCILTSDHVDIKSVLDEFYALRSEIVKNIHIDSSYHKKLSIKDIGAYDASKTLPAQIRGSIVWNSIMPDEEMQPGDRVIVIPLSFKLLHEHAHEDHRTAEILRISLIDNEKEKNDPVICLPEHYHEIPEWVQIVIDKQYAVDKLLMPFKQLFEAFDIVMVENRAGKVPTRMVAI